MISRICCRVHRSRKLTRCCFIPELTTSVRELAQPSTKSALSHTYTRDTRDDPWLGTRGQLLKITHVSGKQYIVHGFSRTGICRSTRLFTLGTLLQVCLAISVVSPALLRVQHRECFCLRLPNLRSDNMRGTKLTGQHFSISSLTSMLFPLSSLPTELPDRLFLGGPNSVRGWKVGGVGLHDGQDSLGGELAWGAGLSVFAPFYGKAHWPVRAHGFLNAGKVVSYDRGELQSACREAS